MKKEKGFTLIELLATIIILGILLIIAIPSVTKYISDSRKSAYVDTAKEIISSAKNLVNEGNYELYDTNTTYYIPTSCIKTENAQKSPYGDFVKSYVVVTYDGKSYDYYFTSLDDSKVAIYLTYNDLLDIDFIKSDVTSIPTDLGVGERDNIVYFQDCNNLENAINIQANSYILDNSYYDPDNGALFFRMNYSCTFNGKNKVITDCGKYNGQKYIDTGIKLYSEDTYYKDYEISFDLLEFNFSNQNDSDPSIFSCKKESGNYPGIVFRKSGNKIQLAHRFGTYNNKVEREQNTVNTVKVIRKDKIIYYSFNNQPLTKLQDMSSFDDYIDNTLLIGAALNSSNNPFRYGTFKIANLKITVGKTTDVDYEKNLKTVFSINGSCTFNGENGVITNCGSYNGQKYIDTGLKLYSSDTFKKDYMISFNIDNIEKNQDSSQATLLANKLESGAFPGVAFRIDKGAYQLGHKYNNNASYKTISLSELKNVKIYRLGQNMYYSFNNEPVSLLQEVKNYSEFFDDTLIIGAARDSSGTPFRYIKATISNLVIKTS